MVCKYFPTIIYENIKSDIKKASRTGPIMELVNEWFPNGKFGKFDTPFWTEFTYEK